VTDKPATKDELQAAVEALDTDDEVTAA